jgi:hypothetical protein
MIAIVAASVLVTYWRANISDEQERYLHSPISRTTCPKEPNKKKGKQKLAVLNLRGHFSLVSGRGPGSEGKPGPALCDAVTYGAKPTQQKKQYIEALSRSLNLSAVSEGSL